MNFAGTLKEGSSRVLMLKITITASYIDGSTRELPGYSIAPGLAVHRAVTMTGEETSDWNVIHTPSGFRVCGSFPTRKQAVEAATEFANLAEWTRPFASPYYASDEFIDVARRVLNIRNRILYAGPLFKTATGRSFTANPEQNQGRFF